MKISFALMFAAVAAFFLWAYPDHEQEDRYYSNQGHIFGTYYNIRYCAGKDLEKGILKTLKEFDNSLSTFNQKSTLSLINQNKSESTDKYFRQMYSKAQQVWQLSDGAFDITVAPLVNAWGFGFKNKEEVTAGLIDSLLQYVGMPKTSMEGELLKKTDPRIMLDASAIAKGQACDVVAEYLRKQGCKNLLVDIGGEVVLQGVNEKGEPWRVGITKPQDDLTGTHNEIQEIISSTSLSMATSGNYRQFYFDNGVRRSHTIDPRTGYPVNHSLLSATVIAENCMTADALATACMVLGKDSALSMISALPGTDCYLIYSSGDSIAILMTEGMKALTGK
ncbi:MAG: FAD:protein FMN transferase [Paludibacteraceae bacterium]|nr:FAD:protein FMN transferase [Paludibacteraceae bacterium]